MSRQRGDVMTETSSQWPARRADRAARGERGVGLARQTISEADVGLVIEEVAEPCATEAVAAEHPEVADTRIVPYFLLVRDLAAPGD